MKSLKSIMLALGLLLVFGAANAATADGVPVTENYVINTYVDAVTLGNLNGVNQVIDANAKFDWLQNKRVVTFNKEDMMKYLNSIKGVQQICTTSTTMVENNADNAVVKVDMNYGDHVQSNLVTIVNTNDGWKITDVYSLVK
jgi:hypothetical protein